MKRNLKTIFVYYFLGQKPFDIFEERKKILNKH